MKQRQIQIWSKLRNFVTISSIIIPILMSLHIILGYQMTIPMPHGFIYIKVDHWFKQVDFVAFFGSEFSIGLADHSTTDEHHCGGCFVHCNNRLYIYIYYKNCSTDSGSWQAYTNENVPRGLLDVLVFFDFCRLSGSQNWK